MKRDLAIRALKMAITFRQPPKGCIHHTNRGSQFCSHDYQELLRQHGFKVSMSGKGNCYDNTAVETFFKTIKAELIWRHPYGKWFKRALGAAQKRDRSNLRRMSQREMLAGMVGFEPTVHCTKNHGGCACVRSLWRLPPCDFNNLRGINQRDTRFGEGAFNLPDRLALGQRERGFVLVHPACNLERYAAWGKRVDPCLCGRCGNDKRQVLHGLRDKMCRPVQVAVTINQQIKQEPAFGIVGKVDDPALEHRRIGNADVVAIKGQQDRRAAGQANDLALIAIDFHHIIGAERLADR